MRLKIHMQPFEAPRPYVRDGMLNELGTDPFSAKASIDRRIKQEGMLTAIRPR